MIDIKVEVNSIIQEIISLRREIHKNPELGFCEYNTRKIIQTFLDKEKISYRLVAKTGICAEINGNNKGKVIALRADMDALPITEKNDIPYKSINDGVMHACGHDAHTAILLGVAKILNKYKEHFCGTVKLYFEPAEETYGGSRLMIEEDVLVNPSVDMIVGLHVTEDIDTGSIKIKKGTITAASNPFSIIVKGRGGHGAYPHKTIDPIYISSMIINGVQGIVSRQVSPYNSAVISFGSINGGSCSNAICEEVKLTGIIRTISNREKIINSFSRVVNNIAKAYLGEVTIDIEEGYPPLNNNANSFDYVYDIIKDIIGKDKIIINENPNMGVESFAYFASKRPSVFYYLGTRNIAKGTDKLAHSSYFNIDEDALKLGIELQSTIAYKFLQDTNKI